MRRTDLTLCFLGQRNYLHGTTLFDALEPWYSAACNIRFKLARMLQTDRVAVEDWPTEAVDATKYAAVLYWRVQDGDHRLGVLPLAPSVAPRREPFDEAAIVNRAQWKEAQVTLVGQEGESFVRAVIALNKVLLFRTLAPRLPGQWLFTRLELARPVRNFDHLRLSYKSNVGLAVVSTTMEADGDHVGNVMFSWLKR